MKKRDSKTTQKKRLPSTDKPSSRIRSAVPATGGPGETLQRLGQEYKETAMRVRSAQKSSQTKKRKLTTSTQLCCQKRALGDGTTTLKDCCADCLVFRCSAQSAMQSKLNEKMNVGVKYDSGPDKPPLAYIPKAALYAEGQAFAYGAKKYDAWNYRNGIAVSRTLSAALRHITQFLSGEDVDPESGVHHLGCARANLGMCLDTLDNHPELDDRFKGGNK